MIAPLALVVFAVLINSVGARLLHGASWSRRSPRLAILLWQALTGSVLLAFVLAGSALVFPSLPASTSVAVFLQACASALQQHYETPAGRAFGIAGGLVAAGVVARVGYCLVVALRTMQRRRSSQLQHLAIASRPDPRLRASIVEHPVAAAYCIPGHRPTVVFTSAAMAQLDDAQLDAVMAHERGHLRGRHDLVLAAVSALRDAFPRLASTRLAQAEVPQLLEMRADDLALRRTDRLTLATALVGLSEAAVPAGAVAATSSALARLRRLAEPPTPVTVVTSLFVIALAVVLLAAPLVIVAQPALAAAWMSYCPIPVAS